MAPTLRRRPPARPECGSPATLEVRRSRRGTLGRVSRSRDVRTGRDDGSGTRGSRMANKWFETVAEAQRRAKKRLPKSVYGALVAGSERGLTLEDNITAYWRAGLRPPRGRPGRRAGTWRPRSWARTSRSRSSSRPPASRPCTPTARSPWPPAAAARGTAMGLSSFASMPVEDVVAANPQTFFQIYWIGTRDQIAGAGRAGPGRRGGRPHRDPRLVVLPRARLGQPDHPRVGGPAGHAALRPRGAGPPALVAGPSPGPASAPDLTTPNMVAKGQHGPDVLRRLRRVDGDAAAELGRRGLAARAVGRRRSCSRA